jgi:hypothetical protein
MLPAWAWFIIVPVVGSWVAIYFLIRTHLDTVNNVDKCREVKGVTSPRSNDLEAGNESGDQVSAMQTGMLEHTVTEEDTLAGICIHYNVDIRTIKRYAFSFFGADYT